MNTSKLNIVGPTPGGPHAGTRWPDLWAALAAEFDRSEVKTLPKGKGLLYITARTAMIRLDEVLGPENWWDDYTPGQDSVMCRLTLRLPDGATITKADAGGYAGMADAGDDDKSGFSDAFKRAAAKFGVARYLYRDGTAWFAAPEPPKPDNATGHGSGAYATPAQRSEFEAWAKGYCDQGNGLWLDKWTNPDTGEVRDGVRDLIRAPQLAGHIVKHFVATGALDAQGEGSRNLERTWKLGAVMWARDQAAVEAEAQAYFERLWKEAVAKLREGSRKQLRTEAPEDEDPDGDGWFDPEAQAREPGSDG